MKRKKMHPRPDCSIPWCRQVAMVGRPDMEWRDGPHMTRWKEAFSQARQSVPFAQTAPSEARTSDMGNIPSGKSSVSPIS